MKRTSTPEQAIFFYVKKYIDSEAENNAIRIGRYLADITFNYKNHKYNVEYDAYSTHSKRIESDSERDKVFIENEYRIIRMRDVGLVALPNVINIVFDFQTCKRNSIIRANEGMNLFLSLFGVSHEIDIGQDLESIIKMYQSASSY